jgi:hypothetical protein
MVIIWSWLAGTIAAQPDPANADVARYPAVVLASAPAAHHGTGAGGGTGDPTSQRRAQPEAAHAACGAADRPALAGWDLPR